MPEPASSSSWRDHLARAIGLERPSLDPGARVAAETLVDAVTHDGALPPMGLRMLLLELRRIALQRQALRLDGRVSFTSPRLVVVTGLPRSGTTLMHHLLTRSLGGAAVDLTRALHPTGSRSDADAQARSYLAMVDRASPRLRAIHPMGPLLPEECSTHEQLTMSSIRFSLMVRSPAYLRAYVSAPAAERRRRVQESLMVLHAVLPADRPWVIKAPSHLFHLDEICDLVPGASVVFLRRDPADAMGSFLGLVAACRRIFDQHGRLTEDDIREWIVAWGDGLRRASDRLARAACTVDFGDLVSDPARVVNQVGEWAGARPISLDAGHAPLPNPHSSRLEDFGVSMATALRWMDA